MWTKNGLKFLMTMATLKNPNNAITLTTTTGATPYAPYGDSMRYSTMTSATSNMMGDESSMYGSDDTFFEFLLGTGTTEPTLDDTTLESVITSSSLTPQSITITCSSADYNISITKVFQNVTSEDIIANEVGIYVPSGSSSTSSPVLVIREVFDTPLTIKAGATKAVTFTIDFSKIND